jgi:hypothetical protein
MAGRDTDSLRRGCDPAEAGIVPRKAEQLPQVGRDKVANGAPERLISLVDRRVAVLSASLQKRRDGRAFAFP